MSATSNAYKLHDDRFNDRHAAQFAKVLEGNDALRDLRISGNRLSNDGTKEIASALKHHQTLQLKITNNHIMTEAHFIS